MINGAFPFLGAVDGWIGGYLPLVARLLFWGAVAGAAAMGLYVVVSNQAAIRRLKAETRALRRDMFAASTSRADFGRLNRRNLAASLSLLARVTGPALLSALPVLVLAVWLDSTLGFTAPDGHDEAVRLTVVSPGNELVIAPCPTGACPQQAGGVRVHWDRSGRLRVSVDRREIYSGNPFSPPTPVIEQRRWWHAILASEVGYLDPQAGVSEIRIGLSRLEVLPTLPSWAAGWEAPFFLSLLVVTLAARFVFHIE